MQAQSTKNSLIGNRRWTDRQEGTPLPHRGGWGLRWLQRGGLRILCYHGVCADEIGEAPWLRSHFVTATRFAQQMETLVRQGPVVYLPDVMARTASGSVTTHGDSFAITFDDVAACSFVHARPVLERLGIRASFFVATGHVASGQLFHSDVVHLLRWRPELLDLGKRVSMSSLSADTTAYKRMTLAEVRAEMEEAESIVRRQLDATALQTLRPLNWEEVEQLCAEGHEIGGHTVDHVILGRQSPQVRREQIANSVLDLERRLHTRVMGFAYPNGGPGDFGEPDHAVLRELGVQYALTTRPGFADGGDILSLPRMCVGLGHTRRRFALELTGLLDRRRRKQYGCR